MSHTPSTRFPFLRNTASFFAFAALAIGACATDGVEPEPEADQIGNESDAIRGGQESPITKPWMVALFRPNGDRHSFLCGGVLYKGRYVVTAAHCVDSFTKEGVACVGPRDLTQGCTAQATAWSIRRDTHPGWDPSDEWRLFRGFDIGIITLDRKFNASAPLAAPGDDPVPGDPAIAAGWGRLSKGGDRPNVLQYAVVPVIARSECYPTVGVETPICTDASEAGICNGDSGGPLLWNDRVVGLSSGSSCSGAGPDLFTRVSIYKSLIDDFIAQLEG